MHAQCLELSIPSHPSFLQLVRGMMKKVGDILELPGDLCANIILAVDEASSNIIKHAYDNDPGGTIDFKVDICSTRLSILITDYGKKYDLTRLRSRALDDVKPGGLGVYIIRQIMDEVNYTCDTEQNTIRMIKYLDAPG